MMSDDSDEESDYEYELDYPEELEVQSESMEEGGGDAWNSRKKSSKFQKELWILKHLPYAESLDEEADHQLGIIKAGMGQSLMLRETRPSLLHWAVELQKYIALNGFRFTKQDHVQFIKVMYELVIMEGLEYRLVKSFSHILSSLLEKKELLSREDLEIPWRPLYELHASLAYKAIEEDGTMLLPENIQEAVEALVVRIRTYFPLSATAEILSEARPHLCPWDMAMLRAVNTISLYLPTDLTAEEQMEYGWKLWFDEAMYWYLHIQNSPPWEIKYCTLFARLARTAPGQIDWSPFYEQLFTRLLRSLSLNVGAGGPNGARLLVGSGQKSLDMTGAADWVAYMLGGTENKAQLHLTTLFQALDSYFHPSNLGKHTDKLLNFLQKLAHAVCMRIHRERHKKPDWTGSVPDNFKLTDAQVDEFVKSVLPCALQGMFTKHRQELAAQGIRYLCFLKPKLVLPAVLEKLHSALETLTEPHRLMNSLNCLNSVIVSLIRDSDVSSREKSASFEEECAVPSPAAGDGPQRRLRSRSTRKDEEEPLPPGGRLQVIPLMIALLPGLDANDVGKAMQSFQALSLFCALVPLVDCSEAVHSVDDLTAEEKELCSATAGFEDFVNLLMEKIFNLIENMASNGGADRGKNSSQATKFSFEETLLKTGICGVYRTILGNCSSHIHNVAVTRLYHFMEENEFESRVAADTIAEMIFASVRSNASVWFPKFLRHILSQLKTHITEETWKEDEIDESLMWYLVLATQVVRTNGAVITEYQDEVMELLRLTQPLQCRDAYETGGMIMEHLLMSLTFIYHTNSDKKRALFDKPPNEFLAVRNWASPCRKKSLSILWHVASEKEIEFAQTILTAYLAPELDKLRNPSSLSNEAVLKSLAMIKVCVAGAGSVMPSVTGKLINLVPEAQVDVSPFSYISRPVASTKVVNWKDGSNIRDSIVSTLHSLTDFLLKEREDDTKSLIALCRLFNLMAFFQGLYKFKYDDQIKMFARTKKIVGDIIRGKKATVEAVHTELALIHHHRRVLERSGYSFNESHLLIMKDLLRLATSHYSVVRKEGQADLDMFFNNFPYCYKLVLDDVLLFLKLDENISHEQFKGALYVLSMGRRKSLTVRQSWGPLNKIWPAIIFAQHSEKPSIIALIEELQNTIVDNLESFQIILQTPKSIVELGREFWDTEKGYTAPAWPVPSEETVAAALQMENEKNDTREREYFQLVNKLGELSNDTDLHWRHLDMAQSLLSLLIRKDMRFKQNTIELFVQLMIHDSLKTRKMACSFFTAWLRITKREPVKEKFFKDSNKLDFPIAKSDAPTINWGFRADNEALLYRLDDKITSEQDYERELMVDKTHWGFSCWPEDFETYSPPSKQPNWRRTAKEVSDEEKPVFEAFQSEAFVTKLAEFLSIEEKKGEDQFQVLNFALFKGLFRNYGDAFLCTLRPLLERLSKSEKEGEQRLATELAAGLVQGSKFWPFTALEEMWSWLKPLFIEAFEGITSETVRNWGTAIATSLNSRDPRRLRWLIQLLLEFTEREFESSFQVTNKFFLIQSGLNQLEWRVISCWRHLYRIIEPLLAQPYQNVRSRLGSCLSTILWFDQPEMTVALKDEENVPLRIDDVVGKICAGLGVLWTEVESGSPQTEESSTSAISSVAAKIAKVDVAGDKEINGYTTGSGESTERKSAILRLKTLLCYLNTHWAHAYTSVTPGIVRLLPLLCYFENETSDDELKKDAMIQLKHGFARMLLSPNLIPLVLDGCQKISMESNWWKSKVSMLRYLQVTVFCNYFFFIPPQFRERIFNILGISLQDPRLEVREAAGETLSGLFHCGYFHVTQERIKKFRVWAKQKNNVLVKHAGVLALAAIVQAHPYTVPSFLPDILMLLSNYATEPQPINGSVRKALSEFKRTHHDSWQEHKELFTDDQLAVLTDLLVSPNYYV